MPMTSVKGRRVTTADAYLDHSLPNLTIRSDAEVAAVLLDGSRARGVRLTDGREIESNHVVLAAGFYGSPVILMRSGIGPADHLRSVGIDVHIDLDGVGSNLADHPQVEIGMAYGGQTRAEPLLHSMATFHSDGPASGDSPDLMLWWSDPEPGAGEFTIEVLLLKPQCRGTVRLRSSAASDKPRITLPQPNAADVRKLSVGYVRAAELAMDERVQRFCERPEILTGDALTEFVRSTTYSIPHVVGTCSMGTSPGKGAVVDSKGFVRGAEGLSVIDASIIPEPSSGFPHLITIMLAERLSDELKTRL